ncbi:MAG TPA: hypothetical protein VN920_11700, partial [Pyrinomonadaceae bacterium]|nr:hypothetical protein [Pyrinomonadaceae bacterium]
MTSVETNERSSCVSGSGRRRHFPPLTSAQRVAASISPLILLVLPSVLAGTIAAADHHVRQAATQKEASQTAAKRPKYQINLALDFDHRSYKGSERIRWTNRGDRAVSAIFFHLYANIRYDQQSPTRATANDIAAVQDEPRIEISEVRSATTDAPLPFLLDDQATVLRVILREPVAPGAATDIAINFKGSVPEIDPEETGLVTHVMKQV